MYCIVLRCIMFCYVESYCIAFHCIKLYRIISYHIVLYCIMYGTLVHVLYLAIIKVREDFYTYRSGVYQYSMPASSSSGDGANVGYHAVKIIGYLSINQLIKHVICQTSRKRSSISCR